MTRGYVDHGKWSISKLDNYKDTVQDLRMQSPTYIVTLIIFIWRGLFVVPRPVTITTVPVTVTTLLRKKIILPYVYMGEYPERCLVYFESTADGLLQGASSLKYRVWREATIPCIPKARQLF